MFEKNLKDNGVSPVIATILLVAITVVLVAIIAAVVMGLGSGVSNTKNVGVTVEAGIILSKVTFNGVELEKDHPLYGDGEIAITVLIYGGTDADKLTALNVSLEGVEGVAYNNFRTFGKDVPLIPITNPIGIPIRYTPFPMPLDGFTDKLLTVTGTFTDGTSAVLYQDTVTVLPGDSVITPLFTADYAIAQYRERPQSPIFS